MSILAQVKARANLSLSDAIAVANKAAFEADMDIPALSPATATWAQVYGRLALVDAEFPE